MGENAVKHVLMVAFHFPPYGMSSGVQRTACFARYLPSSGWQPLVLSASTRAYDAIRAKEHDFSGVLVRAFALDTVRHLGIAGKYPGGLALPDRWISWLPGAVWSGLRLIRKYRPHAIWSTYPIATAHLIGYVLQRITGLPWVADFRDPMLDDVHPTGKNKRRLYRWIEEKSVTRASICCFTTPSAMADYMKRYPVLQEDRCRVVSNGYDELDFINLPSQKKQRSNKIKLLHSGVLYPLERDPTFFFEALAELVKKRIICAQTTEVRLRATGHDEYISSLIGKFALQGLVKLLPSIRHSEALAEICDVDGLLVFQAENCNQQIPAKVYEYLRSGTPVFAMTDRGGDTAQLLVDCGIKHIAPLDCAQEIENNFDEFLQMIRRGAVMPEIPCIDKFSREQKTIELASIFNGLEALM